MLNQWNSLIKCAPYLRGRSNWEKIPSLITQQGNNYSWAHDEGVAVDKKWLWKIMPEVKKGLSSEISPEVTAITVTETVPVFSGVDIRDMEPETRTKIHNVSAQVAAAQSATLIPEKRLLKRRNILRMDEEEYAGHAILQRKAPLLDRRNEATSHFIRAFEPVNRNNVDVLATFQADVDCRPENLKRWWETVLLREEITLQEYNPKRQSVLGKDLALAHFIVFRKGKVKFLGQKDWVTQYRKDAKPGTPEEDLPVMAFELCTLPTNYDPRYRVEAIDCTGVSLHYEGLANFENLPYVKWISLRDSPHVDDWCLDKIARMFNETLEFIDLSGCKKVTDKGIGTFHKCRNLKAIMVENMAHLEDLEIVSAMLEDHNPNMQILGIDYVTKMEKLRLEGEELERNTLLESNETKTIAIEAQQIK